MNVSLLGLFRRWNGRIVAHFLALFKYQQIGCAPLGFGFGRFAGYYLISVAGSSNGRTTVFGAVCLGSNPSPAATTLTY